MPKPYCPECEIIISVDDPQEEPPSTVASAAWNWRSSGKRHRAFLSAMCTKLCESVYLIAESR